MKSERDATRRVRSWLEAGSNGIPDRVLDAVLAELGYTSDAIKDLRERKIIE